MFRNLLTTLTAFSFLFQSTSVYNQVFGVSTVPTCQACLNTESQKFRATQAQGFLTIYTFQIAYNTADFDMPMNNYFDFCFRHHAKEICATFRSTSDPETKMALEDLTEKCSNVDTSGSNVAGPSNSPSENTNTDSDEAQDNARGEDNTISQPEDSKNDSDSKNNSNSKNNAESGALSTSVQFSWRVLAGLVFLHMTVYA